MKTILTIFAIVNLFFVGVIGGLYVLSETYPFQPGDALYGLQGTAEGWRLNLTPGDEKRAELSLELAERRLAELAGAQGEVEIESTVSHVIPELCSGCHTCLTACPYGAITMDETKDPPVAIVTEAKCKGCGTCAAACPSSAIVMYHSTDDQILTMVEAFLCPTPESEGGGSA